MTSYMISVRLDDDAQDQLIGPARYLALDDQGAKTPLDPDAWRSAVLAAFPGRTDAGLPKGDMVFFVHGFNVNAQHAVENDLRNRKALAAQGWDGVYVSYDWPSFGSADGYFGDRSNARASANALIDSALAMFVAALTPGCQAKIGIIAHSMGAFVVREAFSWARQDSKVNNKTWTIAQLLLVAADVAQGSLSASADGGRYIDKYVGRTTLYSNRFDSVLKISDIKNGDPTPRAGRVGLPPDPPESFCGVDCSDLFASLDLGTEIDPTAPHGFYFDQDEFWQDAVLTLGGGIDRQAIPTRVADPAATVANRFTLETKLLDAASYAAALKLAQLGR